MATRTIIGKEIKIAIVPTAKRIGNFAHKGNTGSGIGLNVAKEYVQMHHGKIDVLSSSGKGSCFTVCIPIGNINHVPAPLLPAAPQQEHPVDNPTLPVDYTVRPKILLVEDNNDFRHYLQEELRRHFVVFEASDGEEGEAVAFFGRRRRRSCSLATKTGHHHYRFDDA